MATYSRVKTFVANETLTASDLNTEFNNIITNTNSGNLNSDNVSTSAAWTWTGYHTYSTSSRIVLADNIYMTLGNATDGDYRLRYNSSSTALELTSTNSDGSGTDAVVMDVQDGTDDVRIRGGFSTDNNTAPTSGIVTGGNIVSDTDSTDDLGTTSVRWANLYVDAATITNNLTVGGTLTLTGGLTLNGNVTVGDSASDTLTINSTITSNLLFTDATYDIGASGATRPRDLFLSRNAVMGGTLGVTGATTLSSTLGVTGALTATAGITSGSGIVSDSDSTDDLGTTSVRWANLYVDSIGDTGQALAITAGSNNVNVTAGTLALTGAQTISSTLGVTGLITASGGVSGTTGTFSSTLGVTGATTLSSDVGIGVAAGSALTSTGTTLTIKEDDNTNSANIEMIGGNASGEVAGRIKASYTNNITSQEIRFSLGPNGADNGETIFFTRGPDGFLERFKVGQGTVSVTGDFAVDTDTLFVDASADRVGINTASPTAPLEVYASATTAQNAAIVIDGPSGNNYEGVQYRVGGVDVGYTAQESTGRMYHGAGIEHRFRTGSGGTVGGTDALTIDSSQRVGIGTESPSTLLQLNETYGTAALSISDDSSAGDYLTFQIVGGQYNGGANEIQAINTTDLSLNVATARSLIFKTNNTERARILSSGGITFNGDTAAANALNDYEEGTYSVTDQSGAGLSFTVNSNRYVKIGKLVFISIEFFFPTTSDGTSARISLPFANSTAQRGAMSVVTNRSDVQLGAYVSTLSSAFSLSESAASPASVTNASLSGKYLIISGCYEATA